MLFLLCGHRKNRVSAARPAFAYTGAAKEVRASANASDPGRRLREASRQAAQKAVERLKKLLSDPETSNADVLKAATLIFDRVYTAQAEDKTAGSDYEICVKEE